MRSLQTIKDVYSELVVLGGGGWDVCRLPLDQGSITAFSSTGEDVAAIENLKKNGLTRGEAIQAFTKTELESQKEKKVTPNGVATKGKKIACLHIYSLTQ